MITGYGSYDGVGASVHYTVVPLTNYSQQSAGIAIGLFDFDEKAPGENLNETFTRSGTFHVRCHIHPTMRMTVHVR